MWIALKGNGKLISNFQDEKCYIECEGRFYMWNFIHHDLQISVIWIYGDQKKVSSREGIVREKILKSGSLCGSTLQIVKWCLVQHDRSGFKYSFLYLLAV